MSFEELFTIFHDKTLRYLQYKGLEKTDAEDLCSQIFLYCFQHFHEYNPQKATVVSWLFLITQSRLKNFWRDRKHHIDFDELSDIFPDYENSLDRAEMLDFLRQEVASALMKLPEQQKTIVVLRYFHGMGAKEIGSKLAMTPGAVRVQLSRALDKLEDNFHDFR